MSYQEIDRLIGIGLFAANAFFCVGNIFIATTQPNLGAQAMAALVAGLNGSVAFLIWRYWLRG